tara:strand:- start:390 stop:1184 length:795 start_codon:yes stop_codon:yes gene_type:complete
MVALKLDSARTFADHDRLRSRSHSIETNNQLMLSEFNEHSLEEQRAVSLPYRFDIKFLLPVTFLPELLRHFASSHSILQYSGHRVFTHQHTYFDTPDWDLYSQHHNGKLNRFKYRHRRYLETKLEFLEIKVKTNKRRTRKQRIPWRCNQPIEVPDVDFKLVPKLYVNYRRITLWDQETDERLTLDFDILFQRIDAETKVGVPNVLIAECKRADLVKPSRFAQQLKAKKYYPRSISKYCVGVCLTDDSSLKCNRFKGLISELNKY